MGREGKGWEETQGKDGLLPTKEKSLEQTFSIQPSGSISTPRTLIFFTSSLQNCEAMNFCCLNHPVWVLCYSSVYTRNVPCHLSKQWML